MQTYKNAEMISKVNAIALDILLENKNNKSRENFFPELINRMDLKIGADIGVDKGDFSLILLEKTKLNKLYCIDPWINDFGSDFRPGYFDKSGDVRMTQCLNNLHNYIKDRAIIFRDYSVEAAKKFEDGSLDFIYIDGDHSLAFLLDLYAWVSKVKIGGIISGHDFKNGRNSGIKDYWGQQLDYEIQRSVEYFSRRYGYNHSPVGDRVPSWFFVKQKEINE
jgi:hypothetical protein